MSPSRRLRPVTATRVWDVETGTPFSSPIPNAMGAAVAFTHDSSAALAAPATGFGDGFSLLRQSFLKVNRDGRFGLVGGTRTGDGSGVYIIHLDDLDHRETRSPEEIIEKVKILSHEYRT